MARVGVVICNYNKEDDVLDCIQSVLENKYQDIDLYVVDNASTDGSVEKIVSTYGDQDHMTLIVNDENLGGSGGFNTGLREALKHEHEFLMCVDNDAQLDENCIGALVEHMDSDAETGIAAAKIYHLENSDAIQNYGSLINWKEFTVESIFANRQEDGSLPEVIYSDAVPACALMIRTSVVEKIGLMPEENFLYWDDTEWCVRCTMAGFQVASVAKAQALHAMGAKNEKTNTFPTYYAWRNWLKFFLDHTPEHLLEQMAEVFLNSVFNLNYSCMYRNEPNVSHTVMAAVDDALHGVYGKAGEARIFPVEKEYQGVNQILKGKERVLIRTNEFQLYANQVKEEILHEYPSLQVQVLTPDEAAQNSEINHAQTAVIELCDTIFTVTDLSRKKYFMDLDGNVLISEDDAISVMHYHAGRENFIFSHKPLFLQLAREIGKC
ncbi:MAG: glycosyltransferase family 2 protein [Lachnospiraceae bacterium]|nr:glycosyltransferase family 2 protein [Lachnospiraceae bacterium]